MIRVDEGSSRPRLSFVLRSLTSSDGTRGCKKAWQGIKLSAPGTGRWDSLRFSSHLLPVQEWMSPQLSFGSASCGEGLRLSLALLGLSLHLPEPVECEMVPS